MAKLLDCLQKPHHDTRHDGYFSPVAGQSGKRGVLFVGANLRRPAHTCQHLTTIKQQFFTPFHAQPQVNADKLR
ncbi:hypothetical protein [Cardiobacterium hominis]|uniref:hypothetical protein n=1 Tax=Cardiobacterium hominis TaxID=2718 RepID=UPI0028D7E624|nr:hypothetical protein [Cardiobacterium hominis]